MSLPDDPSSDRVHLDDVCDSFEARIAMLDELLARDDSQTEPNAQTAAHEISHDGRSAETAWIRSDVTVSLTDWR